MRAFAAILWLVVASCTLDVAPSIPEAPSGGTLVVGDLRGEELLAREGYGRDPHLDCAAVCPAHPPGVLDRCHPTRIDPRTARHVAHLGGPETRWIVCYYEVEP